MDYEPDDDEVDVGSFDDDPDFIGIEPVVVNKFIPALTKFEMAAMRAQLLHWIKNNGVQYIGGAGLSPEDVVEKVIADGKLPFRIVRGNGMEVDPNKVH